MEEKPASSPTSNQDARRDAKVEVSPDLIIEEIMNRVRALAEQEPKRSTWPTHPLFLLFAGFFMTAIVGGGLTYFYSLKQQEVAAARSFEDELNKLHITKLAEVWEKLDQDEVVIDRLLAEVNEKKSLDKTADMRLLEIQKLIEEDKLVISKNRFWLGTDAYNTIHNYLDVTVFYSIKKLLEPDSDTESLLQKRNAARFDIDKERAKFGSAQNAKACYFF